MLVQVGAWLYSSHSPPGVRMTCELVWLEGSATSRMRKGPSGEAAVACSTKELVSQ